MEFVLKIRISSDSILAVISRDGVEIVRYEGNDVNMVFQSIAEYLEHEAAVHND